MAPKPTYDELLRRVKELEQDKRNLLKDTAPKEQDRPASQGSLAHKDPRPKKDAEDLGSIINVERLQSIMDDFHKLTGMVTAILDLNGQVIEATGWQDICTKFHRVHPETAKNCTESDLYLVKNLKPGQYIKYQCKNGLWDVASPLYIGDKHLGNIYTGQFFFTDDQVDENTFLKQAEDFGFDKDSYMEAFRRIPRYSKETIDHLMQFLVKLSAYISEVSYAKIQLEKEIKQRQNSEARLRESEDMLRGIFKTARTVSFIITDADDTEPVILEFSPGAEAIFGYKKKEVLGKPTSILHIPSDVKKFPEIHKQMSQGKTGFSGETTLIRKNGEKFHALFSSYPFFNKNGEMYAALGVTFDISKQKNLEAQLLQASKLESVGRLAGGIAHDFNNMLSVIIGNTEMLLEKSPAREIFTSHLKEIYNAAMDSADLTKQLLAYARKQTISPRVIDLNATVAGMTKMLKRLIGEDIELAWLPGEDLWPVRIDPSQLDQILANLCLNARDAIHGVGKVTIETSKADINDAYCAEHLDVLAGEYVLVAVSDNGCGMSAETQKNIFEPFYTTKVTGKGTGLGLATVYGVVKQNNGFVNVYSEPGHGSTLKIYFPRYQDQTEISSSQSNSSPKVDHGHETILLVEDELAILKMAKTMLEMTGYQVMAAETPTEAIRLARNHSGKINLLLTDVVMPEMNGLDLAKNILSFYPNLKLLFMSGYTANIIAKHGILNKGLNFMQKPFSRQTLGSKVRQALDED